jgi:hypothetical protein
MQTVEVVYPRRFLPNVKATVSFNVSGDLVVGRSDKYDRFSITYKSAESYTLNTEDPLVKAFVDYLLPQKERFGSMVVKIKFVTEDVPTNLSKEGRPNSAWTDTESLDALVLNQRKLNDQLTVIVNKALGLGTGGKKTRKTQNGVNAKCTPTKQKIRVGSVERIVYQGPRGGKYIRKNGEYFNIKNLK